MVFNSLSFLVFLAIVTPLYWFTSQRPRVITLAVASTTFYCFWRVPYIALVLASSLVDYYAALAIARSPRRGVQRVAIAASLAVNLGILFYFKYLGFLLENIRSFAHEIGLPWTYTGFHAVLPMGISFYTFQTMSYTIDVYRGFIKPERSFLAFLNYVMFFPQLVAGPILRAREVLDQLKTRPPFNRHMLLQGIRRILMGLFLKCVVADNIAGYVDEGYAIPPELLGGLDAWTIAFLFGFQIYFDFSAYSHIAIGCAMLMGLHFPENFNFPYLACSPKDFWKRWHISLSSWIRDYLYLPLAGERVSDRSTGGLAVAADKSGSGERVSSRRAANRSLFLSWFIMGLWHGASWTFAVWGLYQAALVYAYRTVEPRLRGIPSHLRVLGGWIVTLPMVMIGWLFFRAATMDQATTLFMKAWNPWTFSRLGMRENSYLVAASLLVSVVGTGAVWSWAHGPSDHCRALKSIGEIAWIGVAFALTFVFLRPVQQFIYFQF